jgi:hypothetical protein
MGVEIENLIESSIGVALPPTSLMRARTVGQIASLISEHLGGGSASPVAEKEIIPETPMAAAEVDLDALSDEDIDRLMGMGADTEPATNSTAGS